MQQEVKNVKVGPQYMEGYGWKTELKTMERFLVWQDIRKNESFKLRLSTMSSPVN